jgi:hypothetical protein
MKKSIPILIILTLLNLIVIKGNNLKSHSEYLTDMIDTHSDDEIFKEFYERFEKKNEYNRFSNQGVKKYNTFRESLKQIREHNSNSENTWKMGVTIYSDMTDEEYKRDRDFYPMSVVKKDFENLNKKNEGIN